MEKHFYDIRVGQPCKTLLAYEAISAPQQIITRPVSSFYENINVKKITNVEPTSEQNENKSVNRIQIGEATASSAEKSSEAARTLDFSGKSPRKPFSKSAANIKLLAPAGTVVTSVKYSHSVPKRLALLYDTDTWLQKKTRVIESVEDKSIHIDADACVPSIYDTYVCKEKHITKNMSRVFPFIRRQKERLRQASSQSLRDHRIRHMMHERHPIFPPYRVHEGGVLFAFESVLSKIKYGKLCFQDAASSYPIH